MGSAKVTGLRYRVTTIDLEARHRGFRELIIGIMKMNSKIPEI